MEVLDVDAAIKHEPCLAAHRSKMAGAILAHDDSLLDSGGFAKELARVCKDKYGVQFKMDTGVSTLVQSGGGDRVLVSCSH